MTTAPLPPTSAALRLTRAAGATILVICLLHTLVLSVHPYWADWLAGPFRDSEVGADEAAQFWGLPGGFVAPGALLGLMVLREGRLGRTVPAVVGIVLALWASACFWVVGPSGFLLVLVPAGMLIAARLSRRGSPRSTRTARA